MSPHWNTRNTYRVDENVNDLWLYDYLTCSECCFIDGWFAFRDSFSLFQLKGHFCAEIMKPINNASVVFISCSYLFYIYLTFFLNHEKSQWYYKSLFFSERVLAKTSTKLNNLCFCINVSLISRTRPVYRLAGQTQIHRYTVRCPTSADMKKACFLFVFKGY